MINSITKILNILFLFLIISCGGDIFEKGGSITQDVEGEWPLIFSDLELSGLTLDLNQSKNSTKDNTFTASISGTYTSSILRLSNDSTYYEPSGTLSGKIKDSVIRLTFTNGSSIDGVIWRPTMSTTLVQLQGSMKWVSCNGKIYEANWTTDPRETKSHD
jgi:hypothetical protein